jgi:hypothetical protein
MGDGASDDKVESTELATAAAARKIPFFQYHLSTAIIVMFAASGLLWLNMRLHTERVDLFYGESRVVGRFESVEWGTRSVQGWPLDYMQYSLLGKWYFAPGSLAIDAAIAIILLVGVAALAEALLHRALPLAGDPLGQSRPWFKIHLVTLLVMAIVAGVLFWMQGATAWRSAAVYWGFPFHAYANNSIASVPAYIANLSINLGIVAAAAVSCERRIRRRERP